MNPVGGWQRHMSWLVPLLLIPLSVWIFGLVAMWMLSESEPGPTSSTATWIGVISVILAVVAPIVFIIFTIIGAQKTYQTSSAYARKVQKRNEKAARRMEAQIVQEGGPRCDASARSAARTQAAQWYERFQCGDEPERLQSFNLNLEQGERIFDQLRAKYARYYGMDVTYQTGGVFAMGSPLFVTGALIGSAIGRSNARTRAQQMAAAQWREIQYVDVLITDRRFIIPVGGRTLSFYFNAVVAYFPEIEAMTLTLDYGGQTQPMQLFSPSIASATVLLIRQLQGAEALCSHPAIEPVRTHSIAR